MIETPRIVETDEVLTASLPLVVPRSEIKAVMGPAIREVFAALAAQGIAPAGPWLTHHRRSPSETFDFAACVPVGSPVAPTGRVQPGRIAACRVARTVYKGPYEGLAGAWGEFSRWIEDNGHTPRPDLWEVYVSGPESSPDPSTWTTELNQPLADQDDPTHRDG